MNDGCCRIYCDKVVIIEGKQEDPVENDTSPPPHEPPMPPPSTTCSLARVDFDLLSVTQEPGFAPAEWTLVMEANGVQAIKEYPEDSIDPDADVPYEIGMSVNVPLEQDTTQLHIRITGIERSPCWFGGNDPLPVAEGCWMADEGFGLGKMFVLYGNDHDRAYSVTGRISCAEQSTVVLERGDLVDAVVTDLERHNGKRERRGLSRIERADSWALNHAIRLLERRGWRVKAVDGDLFIFEGRGRIPRLAARDGHR